MRVDPRRPGAYIVDNPRDRRIAGAPFHAERHEVLAMDGTQATDEVAEGIDAEHGLNLPRIQPRILRQEVLAALRTAILANEIKAGVRLLEADIATRMGVSRAPVREALRQLEQEGLVEFFPHRGAVVIGLPESEIDAIYELRSVIEARAMAAASEVVREEDLQRLEELIDEMRVALETRDLDAIAEVDWQFHGLIVDLSGFSLLRRIWSSLDGLVRIRSYQALGRPGKSSAHFLETGVASHAALVDALRSRDPERAAEAGRSHVLEVPTVLARRRDET
jgi:DNA-binding GntR family transcriptional regulator